MSTHEYKARQSQDLIVAPGDAGRLQDRDLNADQTSIADIENHAIERRFQEAFDFSPVGAALATRKGGRIEVNHALNTFFGLSAEDLAVAAANDAEAKDDARKVLAYLMSVLQDSCGSRFQEERRFRRADGTDVWGEVTGVPIPSGDLISEYYLIVVVDITKRKAEQTLSERLLAAIDAFSERVVLYDEADRLVFGNKAFREVNRAVSDTLVPGTPYETYLRAAVAAGTMPEAAGREEAWWSWSCPGLVDTL